MERIRTIYETVAPLMGERARRHWAAAEARAYGWGGIRAVSAATGLSPNTIRKGLAELGQGTAPAPGIRRHGGGRKRRIEEDPGLRPALERLLTEDGAGEASSLRWSCESTASLAAKLSRQGHPVSPRTVGRTLRDAGYRLDANRAGSQPGDGGRRGQFAHVDRTTHLFLERGQPVIVASLRRHTARARGEQPEGRGAERASRRDELAARFAAQAVDSWWREVGLNRIPSAREMLVVVDGCGSDAGRRRACRSAFSALPARLGLPIQVSHLPPGIVRWADSESWTYSKVSRAGRGHAAARHEVVIRFLVAGWPNPDATADGTSEGPEATPEHSTRPALADDWNYRLIPSQSRNRST